ncbi:MAG: carbamoyl-phosphate synthase small subunit, partial [Gammaproteobacteria bacterium]|nr:carbamoyl-phosphate synthase small subunit [Gammaproteobacteria bacterium]
MDSRAVLALENGMLFEGTAIGVDGLVVGEVVFNTSITGYQEILTDPSYARQIITLTHPHIGNTGVTIEDEESRDIWATGLVIRDLPLMASNWRSEMSLGDYLVARSVVAIAEIDTRKLTRVLRDQGSQNGAIVAGPDLSESVISGALEAAKGFAGLEGMDLAKVVTSPVPYEWREGSWEIGQGYSAVTESEF